jgi:hypothetical protein
MSIISRFIGSKTQDGYSWDRNPIEQKQTTVKEQHGSFPFNYSEESFQYLSYAAATATAYNVGTYEQDNAHDWAAAVDYTVINPQELFVAVPGVETRKNCFFDPSTTLKVVLMLDEKKKELLVVFGATNGSQSEAQDPAEKRCLFRRQCAQIVFNLLGGVPASYLLADKVVSTVRSLFQDRHSPLNRYKDYTMTLVGHSQGGSLAQYVSLKQGTPSRVINSAPLGAGLQYDIGSDKLKTANRFIQHLSVDGDWLSDHPLAGRVDKIISALGIRTPGSFGIRKSISSPFKSRYEHHAYIVGSIGEHAGVGNPHYGQMLKNDLLPRYEKRLDLIKKP